MSQGEGVRAATTLLVDGNHIVYQRVLLYRYLPHQFGYGFFYAYQQEECKCNVAMNVLNNFIIHNLKIITTRFKIAYLE
jgi:hypothetical protein